MILLYHNRDEKHIARTLFHGKRFQFPVLMA